MPVHKCGVGVFGLAALGLGYTFLLTACQTEARRKAAENARVQEAAAKEMQRICALPDEQRETELKEIRTQWGIVVYCGNK